MAQLLQLTTGLGHVQGERIRDSNKRHLFLLDLYLYKLRLAVRGPPPRNYVLPFAVPLLPSSVAAQQIQSHAILF